MIPRARVLKLDEKPFHTNAYAKAMNAGRAGSTSTMSFEKRQQIEQNRQEIGSYRHSALGRTVSEFRPKAITDLKTTSPVAPAEAQRPYNPYG
jgi:hypothetical protein